MSHHAPPPLACARVGCSELATEQPNLCRYHWLEFVERAFRYELEAVRGLWGLVAMQPAKGRFMSNKPDGMGASAPAGRGGPWVIRRVAVRDDTGKTMTHYLNRHGSVSVWDAPEYAITWPTKREAQEYIRRRMHLSALDQKWHGIDVIRLREA